MKTAAFLFPAVLALAVGPAALAAAEAPAANLVTARLVADATAVQSGRPFTVGVLLDVRPGWHVYWVNPGDSGAATTISLKLPAGFTAGPVRFPVPERLVQPGNMVCFGYTGQVLFVATVTPPKDLSAGVGVPIEARVSWLCCEDVCIPGGVTVRLALQAADSAAPAEGELFAKWLPRMPVPPEDSPDVRDVKTETGPSGHGIAIVVDWKQRVSDVQFFPGPSDALMISSVSIAEHDSAGETESRGSRINVVASVLQGMKLESDRLPSVVAFTDSSGQRRGITVDVPLQSLKTNEAAPK